ncbi:MAG TPA: DUF5009 domain-containing protein [Firmicutes bacterium]|nr:DUF5009 domain-containing protein [Bacillota bacterium]HHY99453.1 DUF5009 domain-containing protein [Bacillota bacterium]
MSSPKGRLMSLDALRGFDMFWIIGARGIVDGLMGLGLPGTGFLINQLTHSEWDGFTFYDLIFPLFIFIVGVSLVFSLRRRLERGDDHIAILRHVATRALILFLLGIFYNIDFGRLPAIGPLRVMGVLQRIALAYFFASILALKTHVRVQAAVAAGLLFGYWLIMRFIPVPGMEVGVLAPGYNLAAYVDSHLLPGHLYYGTWDPEGILSTLPAIATCLLGVLAGHWLSAEYAPGGHTLAGERKAGALFLSGAIVTVLGLLAGLIFPINKSLWTSSFALLTGGISAMLLAVFYWIIDVRGHRRWAFPFVVIGLNSIAIYLAVDIIPFGSIAKFLVGTHIAPLFGRGQELFEAGVQLFMEWLILYWMYRKRIFIRL